MAHTEKAKAKGRKIGRNKLECERYKLNGTRMKNKILKLRRHIKRNAYDVARKARRGRIIGIDKRAISALKRMT